MIKSVQIKNFKSIVDLSLDLGSFNVLIGENGCGKSNILEAIGFGAAASANKLDYEFLGSRGLRVTNPEFMFSAFTIRKEENIIRLDFNIDNEQHYFDLINDPENSKKWVDKNLISITKSLRDLNLTELMKVNDIIDKSLEISVKNKSQKLYKISDFENQLEKFKNQIQILQSKGFLTSSKPDLSNFIIYSPEQSSLRKFEETTQIYPLGIKGEGLFQYLKELAIDEKNEHTLAEIKQNMIFLDWYEDFDLPESLMKNEFSLKIRDKYLNDNLQYFDQRSTNEGFLFLLFYSTLFISKMTPTFFAIDNIDASFNPKLCMQLTKNLTALAKKHNKQVLVTTHNPAILDGLNLEDDNQRLFVVRRNDEGHTKAKRIEYKSERRMKLSEIWTKGFIGGLPENF